MRCNNFSAVKFIVFLALSTRIGMTAHVHAGIPVIDAANLTQTVMSSIENVAQTLKQIEQYRTQLHQHENMIHF